MLDAVRDVALDDGAMIVVRQHAPLGLGHAVWCARHAVGREPFAVLLPDELLLSQTPCLAQMTGLYADVGGAVLATRDVAPELTKRYGVLDPDGAENALGLTPAKGMVEKPDPDDAPSTARRSSGATFCRQRCSITSTKASAARATRSN